jgi:hypothetical protein
MSKKGKKRQKGPLGGMFHWTQKVDAWNMELAPFCLLPFLLFLLLFNPRHIYGRLD